MSTNPAFRNDPAGFFAIQLGTTDAMRIGGASGDNSGQLAGFRNILINSTFQINNGNTGTPYVSGAVLAAGQTGHECWKAGAAGGDYTFTQNPAITSITIASGKSLIQVIEDKFVEGGTYCISWTGTAKARVGVNTATPSGAYSVSPIVVTGQSTGVTMSVEFTNDGTGGTLTFPHNELGSLPTKREFRQDELQRTQRYAVGIECVTSQSICMLMNLTTGTSYGWRALPVSMRVAPVLLYSGSNSVNYIGQTGSGVTTVALAGVSDTRNQVVFLVPGAGFTAGQTAFLSPTAALLALLLSARL